MYGGAPQLAPGQPPAQQMFPQPQQPQQSQQPGVPPGHVAIQTPHGVMVIPAPGGVPTSQPVGPVPVIPGTPQHAAIPMIPGQQGAQPMLPGHPVGVNPHARVSFLGRFVPPSSAKGANSAGESRKASFSTSLSPGLVGRFFTGVHFRFFATAWILDNFSPDPACLDFPLCCG